MTDKVQVEIKGDVATILLNKPERLNALDNEMWHGIGEACRAVDAAPDVRVAVLMGAGGCFCAGLDVKAGSTLSHALDGMSPGQALAHIRRHLEGHQASFSAVESLR
ncbi:MAG TPA: enoyl-CoA hydratase-related protein, partial [Methylomirabilota bacterium]